MSVKVTKPATGRNTLSWLTINHKVV